MMVYFSFRRPAVVYIGSIGNKSVLTLLHRDIQCNGHLSVSFFFCLLDYDGHTSVIDAACLTSFTQSRNMPGMIFLKNSLPRYDLNCSCQVQLVSPFRKNISAKFNPG